MHQVYCRTDIELLLLRFDIPVILPDYRTTELKWILDLRLPLLLEINTFSLRKHQLPLSLISFCAAQYQYDIDATMSNLDSAHSGACP